MGSDLEITKNAGITNIGWFTMDRIENRTGIKPWIETKYFGLRNAAFDAWIRYEYLRWVIIPRAKDVRISNMGLLIQNISEALLQINSSLWNELGGYYEVIENLITNMTLIENQSITNYEIANSSLILALENYGRLDDIATIINNLTKNLDFLDGLITQLNTSNSKALKTVQQEIANLDVEFSSLEDDLKRITEETRRNNADRMRELQFLAHQTSSDYTTIMGIIETIQSNEEEYRKIIEALLVEIDVIKTSIGTLEKDSDYEKNERSGIQTDMAETDTTIQGLEEEIDYLHRRITLLGLLLSIIAVIALGMGIFAIIYISRKG
jgi:chromosome segregation ATPase